MPTKIPKRIIDIISNKLSDLFEGIKSRLTGRGKRLVITHDSSLSIPKIYEQAVREEGGLPNIETLEKLVNASNNYLDALKLKTINQTVKDLEQHLHEEKQVSPETINASLKRTWDNVTPQVQRIVDTETQTAKSFGLLEGIIRMNASFGIDDPVVFFITPVDEHICEECLRLHLMPDGMIPRLWYLSELKRAFGKRGDDTPAIQGQHPHCRGMLTTLTPGFGFNSRGKVTYITNGHLELQKQREQ